MKDFWIEVLDFTRTITKEVGNKLKLDFGQVQGRRKPDGSLVTKADQWADSVIREAISARFPKHGILTEETLHIFPENDWCWIVDPIDGTTNFTRGIAIWGISLGLLYQGTPIFGAVYFPLFNEFFHGYWYGESGLEGPIGAYKNGELIQTSQDDPSQNHIFSLCARSTAVLKKPFPCKIRLIGVASYNCLLVASGAALGGVEATPKVWDIAAVWAIVKAAGGVFLSLTSEPAFPLKVGEDYGNCPFPSLVSSQEKLLPTFKPLVSFLGS